MATRETAGTGRATCACSASRAFGTKRMMFKSAEPTAEAGEGSGTKNSRRSEASSRSPHAEKRAEVWTVASAGTGRRAVVAVRR
jgi:hypothetical protein